MPSSPVLIFKIECTISLKLPNTKHKSTTRICWEKKGVYNSAQELYFFLQYIYYFIRRLCFKYILLGFKR